MPTGIEQRQETTQDRRRQTADMAPLIVTCAITGDHSKRDNPSLPTTAEEQGAAAAEVEAAGAAIVHIHGRKRTDPTAGSIDPEDFLRINAAIREQAPRIIIDSTQTVSPIEVGGADLLGKVYYYKSAPMYAKPEIMALNPGPMTFRGNPSAAYVTTFDDTARAASQMAELGIKPQIFLYHPGHLDLLDYLIKQDAITPPYFVQLVFGQQSGIPCNVQSVLYMAQQLPPQTIFQTCALGLDAVEVNTLAMLIDGHVRTGMEDALEYRRNEPTTGNSQLVDRIVSIADQLGRRVASPDEARAMLGLGEPSTYD